MVQKHKVLKGIDQEVQLVLDVLQEFQNTHPNAKIDAYRQNPASIRVRIVDPIFQNKDRVERDEALRKILDQLPEEIFTQITMLILLTPKEVKTSFANMEFEDPVPSSL